MLGIALTLERSGTSLAQVDTVDLIRRLSANARKLDRLLTDLLDLDRLSRGIVAPKRRPTDVAALVSRMAEHTPPDAPVWLGVRRHGDRDGDGVLLIVEDAGAGVPPELRASVFEPFRQGPESPAHTPGVGIGLTLVARFAALHGGRAWVDDREGGGSSFKVLLPGSPEQRPEPQRESEPAPS